MSHHRQRKIWAKRKKVWYIRCTASYPSVNFLQFCKADLNEPHKKMWGSKLLNLWDICQALFCVQQSVHWKWNDLTKDNCSNICSSFRTFGNRCIRYAAICHSFIQFLIKVVQLSLIRIFAEDAKKNGDKYSYQFLKLSLLT